MDMKVKELIEQLSKLDPEVIVVKAGYEGGVTEIAGTGPCTIALDINNEWYYGPHELVTPNHSYPFNKQAKAVFIS
jgi:hypothetical protein